jgi:DNA-binding MarR family transcriptional regulator
VLFGVRPPEVAFIPGEVILDAMLRALKAFFGPARLHNLRYLSNKPQPPSQLTKKLQLQSPKVIQHLNNLRLAGIVYVTLEDE